MTSRSSPLVAFLLGLAVAAMALAGAIALGLVPQLTGGVPPSATATPAAIGQPTVTPEPLPTDEPTGSPVASPTARPTATGQPTARPQPTPGGTYVVQSGDTLSRIGEMFGVPWPLIAEANGITEPYLIQVGQELIIPAPGTPAPDADHYIVQPGDTLDEIAYQLRVSPARLAEVNGIENPDEIYVGQRLLIPGRGEPTASPEPTEEP